MITINGLKKKFGKLEVLRNIDISIKSGGVTALVGPNGSGKTTIIKSILGLVKPDQGNIIIKNETINGDCSYRKNIGYMPQLARYPDNLTVNEVIKMIKDLRNVKIDVESDLVKKFGLINELNKPIRTLSGGTRQKLSIVIAFMFDPEILILDEPTASLDPLSSSILKELIGTEKHNGKTILLTSHFMNEVEELADEIIFLLDGEIHYKGKVSALLKDKDELKLEKAVARIITESMRWN
ncbi:MAG: hypothetical protein Kow0098_12510 [Ignavibacteriaceae bacterium]